MAQAKWTVLSPHLEGELLFRFSYGASRVLPRALTIPETGVLGNGCSVSSGGSVDEATMARFGRVDRVLTSISESAPVLELVYGDHGSVMQQGRPSWRWRSVAHLTPAVRARAERWCAYHSGEKDYGPPALRWCRRVWDPARKRTRDDYDALRVGEEQAWVLIHDAERAFAAAYNALRDRQRQIRHAEVGL